MITIKKIEYSSEKKPCVKGSPYFRNVMIEFDSGKTTNIITCRCGNGCDGTAYARDLYKGKRFENIDSFWNTREKR